MSLDYRQWVSQAPDAGPLRAYLRSRGFDGRDLDGLSDDVFLAVIAEATADEIGEWLGDPGRLG